MIETHLIINTVYIISAALFIRGLKQLGSPESARKGNEVEVKPRKIRINELELMNIDLPYIQLRVSCSKGTYIRSLAYDIGKALNSGAWLCDLKRTKIGLKTLNNALDIQAFQQMMK